MSVSRPYEFRVEPAVPESARDVFCDMDLEATPGGTVLRGTVIDDSHLHGILGQLHALGLTVVGARPLDGFTRDARRTGPTSSGDAGTDTATR
jgi:hypothetical protein